MSGDGGIGNPMDDQVDNDAGLATHGSSSSQPQPQRFQSRGPEGYPDLPTKEDLEVSSILSALNLSQLPNQQSLVLAPRPPTASLQISTSLMPIPNDDEGHSPSSSAYETPSTSFGEEPPVSQITNHYHIERVWNASFGNNYGAFNQTMGFPEELLQRLPNLDGPGDPTKMALAVARAVTEIKQAIQGSTDVIESRIRSTAAQLLIMEKEFDHWPEGAGGQKNPAMREFNRTLSCELNGLRQLQEGSNAAEKGVDYNENERDQIAQIFENMNGARMRFELDSSIRLHGMVDAISRTLKRSLRKDLEASDAADYKYVGEDQETLYRVPCTRGTRVGILDTITGWANGHGRQSVFWLFGPAGSGKSTIAYTIARRFELTSDPDDTIVLGGNFFCSRQVKEARHESQVIRTIAYHIALKCKPFADALERSGKFETIHHSVRAQIQGLLVGPWKESRSIRSDISSSYQYYLIIIDAVDELVRGGSEFLRGLLAAINEHDLPGLKFLVTSRSDPKLVEYVESFKRKELYCLQNVEKDLAQADVKLYLEERFPHFRGCSELETLLTFADGLFICAATLARHLEPESDRFTVAEQRKVIQRLTDGQATSSLNALYDAILSEAFKYEGDILATRIDVLYTFLCTAEPTTTALVADLLSVGSVPAAVLSSLHAVLYTDAQHRILSYHKSFSDFMFDRLRCPRKIWQDQTVHHRRLTESCFRVMNARPSGLRFNIANIPSSFVYDSDNEALQGEVEKNISAVLSYSCRSWSHHLALASEVATNDPLNGILTEFLQLDVLFWIEAMNLLECRGHCRQMLQAAGRWLAKCYPTLASKFSDVASFALYFSGSPAALSTPHLYLSALATWGRDGEPFKSWRDRFRRIPRFTTNTTGGTRTLMSIKVGYRVYAMALACNGTRIVTGSEEGSVQVWSLATGEQERVFECHTARVRSVASSSDGTRIVSGSDDGTMRVWNAETGAEEWAQSHDIVIWSVAISSDGSRIASGFDDKSVRVWDARTGEGQMVLGGHTGPVRSVAFSSGGIRLVSGSSDKTVRVWNIMTGEVRRLLEGHGGEILSVAFSADGTRIISGSSDDEVRLWDAETGQMQRVLECAHSANSVALSSGGTRVVAGLGDGSMQVWNALTGEGQGVIAGHGDAVNSVAFLGDDAQVVSGSEDGLVCVWDLATGGLEELGRFQGHTGGVHSVAFSTDGRRIVSGSSDRSIRLWGSVTGQEQKVLEGHTSWARSVAFSNDDTRIVSGSDDHSIRLWNTITGLQQRVLQGHASGVRSVSFSPNDKRVVSGSADRSIRLWDAETGQQRGMLKGHTDEVWSVAFSTDGLRIVSGSDDHSVRLWDVTTGQQQRVLTGHTGRVRPVAFSKDDTRIVSGSSDRSIRLWDAVTGHEQMVLKGHTSEVWSVTLSNDGTHIVSGSDDHSIRLWDAKTGQQKRVLKGHTNRVRSVAFSNDGARIVSGSEDNSVRLWDVATGQEPRALKGQPVKGRWQWDTHGVHSVSFSTDGTRIVSGSADKSIRLWCAATGEAQRVLDGHTSWARSVVFSNDSTRIASGSDDHTVRLWNAATGQQQRIMRGHTSGVRSVSFSPDGRRIISGSADRSIRLWDAATGREQGILKGHADEVWSVAFSTDGMRIVSGSDDRSIRLWDATTGQQQKVLKGHTGWVRPVVFSKDCTRIVSGSSDRSVRLWDAMTGQERSAMWGHTSEVWSVAFSNDGSYVVSGSDDHSIRLWDATTGQQRRILEGHTSRVRSVAFSANDMRIVSGSEDNSIRVWDLDPSYMPELDTSQSNADETVTGWLLSSSIPQGRLMYVPPDALANIPRSPCILTITHNQPCTSIDFSTAAVGGQWQKCYTPLS